MILKIIIYSSKSYLNWNVNVLSFEKMCFLVFSFVFCLFVLPLNTWLLANKIYITKTKMTYKSSFGSSSPFYHNALPCYLTTIFILYSILKGRRSNTMLNIIVCYKEHFSISQSNKTKKYNINFLFQLTQKIRSLQLQHAFYFRQK